MKIAVFGATGNTGGAVVQNLLKQYSAGVIDAIEEIRGVTRNRSGKTALETSEGSPRLIWKQWDWQADGAFVNVLSGCDAAYFMVPTGLLDDSLFKFRDEYSRRFYEAAQSTGIKKIVHLSSFGAHNKTDSGVLEGLYQAEENSKGFSGDVDILRPGYFYQNFKQNIGPATEKGFFGGYPIETQARLLFASVQDIGKIATELLMQTGGGRRMHYVGDSELHSFKEVCEAFASALCKPELQWTNVGYEKAREHMNSKGIHPNLVDNFISFFNCINSGRAMDDYDPDKLLSGDWDLAAFKDWIARECGSR